jgi:hypothetical protein
MKTLSFSLTKDISMALWKVSPSFIIPKGIFSYMKVPQGVVKVVFYSSSRCTIIWLYQEKPSRIVIF